MRPIGSARELDAGTLQLTWVPATVLADRPAKIASESSPDEEVTIANNISALMRSAHARGARDLAVFRARRGRRCADARADGAACTSAY
jgi:hypothetical protein